MQRSLGAFPDSYHGSGCTLASAVAAHLAHGLPISDAVHEAQNYTWQTLKAGFRAEGQFIPIVFSGLAMGNDRP